MGQTTALVDLGRGLSGSAPMQCLAYSVRYREGIARLAFTAALIGSLLVLAACGQNDDPSGEPAPQPPSGSQASQNEAASDTEQDGSSPESSGSTGADPEPLARDEFVRQSNAICDEATQATEALAAPASLVELAFMGPELQDIARREVDRLQALGQPTELSERLDPVYFSLLVRQIELLEEFSDAVSGGNLAGARDVLNEAASLNEQAAAIATGYGLTRCAGTSSVGDLSDEPQPEALTPTEEFVAAADNVCRSSRELVDELQEPQTAEESAEILVDVIDISAEELRQLRALEAPEALATRFAELLELREQQLAALELLGETLSLGDRDAIGEALRESGRLNTETGAIERELGFTLCGVEPVQEVPNQQRSPAEEEPADDGP